MLQLQPFNIAIVRFVCCRIYYITERSPCTVESKLKLKLSVYILSCADPESCVGSWGGGIHRLDNCFFFVFFLALVIIFYRGRWRFDDEPMKAWFSSVVQTPCPPLTSRKLVHLHSTVYLYSLAVLCTSSARQMPQCVTFSLGFTVWGVLRQIRYNWAVTCDSQQCSILTRVDSDGPVQPPFKLKNSKWCSVSSLTVIECEFAS